MSIRSSALIRPASEVNTLRSIASGRVKEAYLTENKKVKEGDRLYVLESETLNEQEHFSQEKIALKETFIQDVLLVLASSQSPSPNAQSPSPHHALPALVRVPTKQQAMITNALK